MNADPTEKKQADRIQVLLLGPMPIPDDHVGGAKAAFFQMVEDIQSSKNVEIDLINLSRPLKAAGPLRRAWLNLIGLLNTVWAIAARGQKSQVWAVNVSPVGSFTLLPIIICLARIYRKPVIARMFGGSFSDDYKNLGKLRRSLYGFAFRSCFVVTMETKKLTEDLRSFDNVKWFPNTRNNPLAPVHRKICERMIFLSQLRQEKGVREIIQSMGLISSDVHIDFYGSPFDSNLVTEIENTANLSYCGVLAPAQVYATLNQYDALVLPSFWQGEGLPGVIVEAFQSGMPVIASDWRQIPELVTNGHDGLLVKPKSSKSLAAAIDLMTSSEHEFRKMSNNAITTGNQYRSQQWNDTFCQWCIDAHQQNILHKIQGTGQ